MTIWNKFEGLHGGNMNHTPLSSVDLVINKLLVEEIIPKFLSYQFQIK